MTSREIVLKTLEFDGPGRIPRQLWTLPWATARYPQELAKIHADFPPDIRTAPSFLKTPTGVSGDPYAVGEYRDEWGCTFTNVQQGVIGEIKRPLIAEWEDLAKVREPVELLSVDVDAVNGFCRGTEQFVLAGCCPRPWERVQFLRGSENAMLDLAAEEPALMALIQRLHQFYLKKLEIWARTEVDALMFMDDWGAQRSLLISPRVWRAIFKPLYRDYIELAHRHHKKIFMHSDGYILDIIPDLIELGLDALNSQLFCMGVEEVGRFAGKLTFWGELDRQHLLVRGTTDEVAQAVRDVHRALCRNGGVIAQMEFGPGARPENVYAGFQTWNSLTADQTNTDAPRS